MHDLIVLIQQHQLLAGAIAAIVASNAVRALPPPEPNGSRFYLWFYAFTQGMLANYELARNKKA